ncbi:MAG: MgtC/SapB family protein [Leptolyngbyaceae cyanobacterium SM2_3_12]|nr:MgtC/SapB family protein [Leptolyngbyaceae cyanobacterium SM2_3_12]
MPSLSPIGWNVVMARLGLALLFGAGIGLDREHRDKPAGLRTNMLVALGSALFVLIPVQTGLAETDSTALARSIQGIITGVGFVGAGSILRENKDKVRGLTSATAVWISAGIGIANGSPMALALTRDGGALIILRVVKLVEKYF